MHSYLSRALLTVPFLLLLSCGQEATAPGTPDTATRLVLITPPPADALDGVALTQPPVVELQTASGAAVPTAGVPVTVSASVGTVSGTTTVQTNDAGRAVFADLALGGTAGSRSLRFDAPSLSAAVASVRLRIRPNVFVAASDTVVSAPAGTVLSPGPAVRLSDPAGTPISGASILFTFDIGAAVRVATDGNGVASLPSYTLPRLPSSQIITAQLGGTAQSVRFAVSGTASGTVEILPSINLSFVAAGSTMTLPVIRVTDGLPVEGAEVQLSVGVGGGVLSKTVAVTDANGEVNDVLLTVGNVSGEHHIDVVVPGHSRSVASIYFYPVAAPVQIFAEPIPDGAPGRRVFSYSAAVDANGNLLCGYPITASVVGGAGTVTIDNSCHEWIDGGWLDWQLPPTEGTFRLQLDGPLVATPTTVTAVSAY